MMRSLFFCFCLGISLAHADEVIWKGQVTSDGTPTDTINLKMHDSYQIKVSQFINLGKWIQAHEKLANDACFEFSEKNSLTKLETFKNSLEISVCEDNKYHPDHVYISKPFKAEQNRIFFWVYDTDYDDNSGVFDVEIIHKSN